MTKIEEVAKAIEVAEEEWGLARPFKAQDDVFLVLARAAISAIREPTKKMLRAGDDQEWDGVGETLCHDVWCSMIDAALTEKD